MKRTEGGSGLLSSFLGAVVFLAFVMLATHTLVSLYATSVITAVAWDSARAVASDIDRDLEDADVEIAERLNGFDNVTTNWQVESEAVGLTVTTDRPMLLPRGLTEGSALIQIERTVWVRGEELR